MNVCRFGYKRSDGKCALNGKKCRESCGSNVEVEPPTHKDVLLKTWAQDTEAMAKKLIKYDLEDGGYFFDSVDKKSGGAYTELYQVALDGEIAYLNSPAEKEGATK